MLFWKMGEPSYVCLYVLATNVKQTHAFGGIGSSCVCIFYILYLSIIVKNW